MLKQSYLKHQYLKYKSSNFEKNIKFNKRVINNLKNSHELIDFSNNDYLNLSTNHDVVANSIKFTKEYGVGSKSARLLMSNNDYFLVVEEKLAKLKKTEKALIFNSGYQANSSIISTILNKSILKEEPLVFSDKLNHNSIHAGCNLAQVKQIRFKHLDYDHLTNLLEKYKRDQRAKFILTESVFSMDGDICNLKKLIKLKNQYQAFLYLDEAHSTGILGKNNMGLSSDYASEIDLVMGTFSKAAGCFGAYVACNKVLYDFLLNYCGGFIYSTALPPSCIGSIDKALDLIPIMKKYSQQIIKKADDLRSKLKIEGFDTLHSTTNIIPIIIGNSNKAMLIKNKLLEEGFLVSAIREPTVPSNTARLRIAINAKHTDKQINQLFNSLLNSLK